MYILPYYIYLFHEGTFYRDSDRGNSQNKKTETIRNNDFRLSVDIFDLLAGELIKLTGNVTI